MNIMDFEIMNKILQEPFKNQRELAKRTGYSVGKVNSSLKMLLDNGYLNKKFCLTEKTLVELEEKKT